MSIKAIWKDRALLNLKALPQDDITLDEDGVPGFVPVSFADIRKRMGEELKRRIPDMAMALDDPSSNISALLDSVAAADADLFKQCDEIIKFIGKAKRT